MPYSRAILIVLSALLLTTGILGTQVATVQAATPTSTPYLSLSIQLANKLHDYMLNPASGAYYYSLSSNWLKVTTSEYSTLGNAFVIDGFIQLYDATGNSTYLLWASHTANQFWRMAWDSTNEGFYDDYSSTWVKTTCTQTLQNNAMFLIEFLNLYATNGSSIWLQRANSVVNTINNRDWDPSAGVVEVSYDPCTGKLSGDVHIEESVGSYLWAVSQWTEATGNTTFVSRMESTASFALNYLWDGPSNTLPGGPDSTGCTAGGYLGFMRSVYANLSGLEDCRKGANENAWGAMGLAYLYSVTGNPTYMSYAEQALNWINSTLWDTTYGGFHQDTFRDNVLRSACSSTDEADDYPGWTEGEQPWLWWNIGHLLGIQSYDSWALVSGQWTAAHQWNSTANSGGDMTCLNSNTLPDTGSDNGWIYDWIQGSALLTYSLPMGYRTEPVELSALMTLYTNRPDLQSAFPEAAQGNYANLVNWAYGVVTQQWTDSGYNALAPYSYWYTLMHTYDQRPDLQKAFPDAYVSAAGYQALVNWADGVVTQKWSDSSYSTLQPFGYWYVLLGSYDSRPDLQTAFPNAYYSATSYQNLINWAGGVVTQQWTDSSYSTLSTYGYWYDLLMTYNQRPDLQAAFPNVYTSQSEYQSLINWANGVVTKAWADSSYTNLSYYTSYYEAHAT